MSIDPDEIHILTLSENEEDRFESFELIQNHFLSFFDNEKISAWNDLLILAQDHIYAFACDSASLLIKFFNSIPYEYKCIAWQDLIEIARHGNIDVRDETIHSLGDIFEQIPNEYKPAALSDLVVLITDCTSYPYSIKYSLKKCFSSVQNEYKFEALNHLHTLVNHDDKDVKEIVAQLLGLLFENLPTEFKNQAVEDLYMLMEDVNDFVKFYAIYNLGKIEIYNAYNSEDPINSQLLLENAIVHFNEAAKISFWNNPARFCNAFYSSFYALLFKKGDSNKEIEDYIATANKEIEGSESKKKLVEFVEQLAAVLRIVHNIHEYGSDWREALERCSDIFNHVEQLMDEIKEKTPVIHSWYQKLRPSFYKTINDLVYEFKEKAEAVCKQTKGTPAESLGLETNRAAEELFIIPDYSMLNAALNEQIEKSKNYCGFIVPGKKSQFHKIIEETRNIPILDGEDIAKKMKLMGEINDFILENALFPRIKDVRIADRIKENVRIAAVQLNYTLSDNFPYCLKEQDKGEMKNKILNALKTAQEQEVNIVCLPELCICEEWLSEIRESCRKMIVISGTYYDNQNHNICRLITDLDIEIPPQLKLIPSDFEGSNPIGQRMLPGEKVINVYESQFGNFAILICRDFGNFSSYLKGIVDLIICPSYNEANERFHNIAHVHVTDSPSYIIISNTAQYGGTSIFGRMKKGLFGALEQSNYKEKGDNSYKLCQIEKGKEGMIIADFNLIHKSPPIQAPMNPDEEIVPVQNINKILF
jgi:predicted amidohydrolase